MSDEENLREEEVGLPFQAAWIKARLLLQILIDGRVECVENEKVSLSSVKVSAVW